MLRTQIQVSEGLYERLRRLAKEQDRSIAECIRDGIEWAVRSASMPGGRIEDIAGKFRPQPHDDLKPHDQGFIDTAAKAGRRP
ncbi:MAG: ribbon-helix-helix protein, CopG family [Deltaproteobacteria bacterium]|nr:ribbon-helix-helix protein, CopG family [Deltaproteobacteria bacterium]